ncbi:MAG: putative RNA uridine N3 methyltransferase [Desulfurococcaceae archaeon]
MNYYLRVILPTSILEVEHSLLLKSNRIHQVARWCSIFGVKEVVFYKEFSTSIEKFARDKEIIEMHWKYFFTPPYLRKVLVPINPLLRHVGLWPPIRLEIYDKEPVPRTGEYRLGYSVKSRDGYFKINIDGKNFYRAVNADCEEGLVLVVVKDVNKKLVECINSNDVYTGPRLKFAVKLIDEILEHKNRGLMIATDRKGRLPSIKDIDKIRGYPSAEINILFGSPRHDLFEIANGEGFDLDKYVDFIWNTIPGQKVVSIRTEEALLITLGVLNMLLNII